MADKTFKLNTGAEIPAFGLGECYAAHCGGGALHPRRLPPPPDAIFRNITGQEDGKLTEIIGTWQGEPGKVKTAVAHALKEGYKLVDCAYCYGNEDEVGEGLAEAFAAGVQRKDVFVITKVWATYNSRVELGLDKSLKALGLDYVDMLLVHWPLLLNPEGE